MRSTSKERGQQYPHSSLTQWKPNAWILTPSYSGPDNKINSVISHEDYYAIVVAIYCYAMYSMLACFVMNP